MNKVILTQEQAEALETAIDEYGKDHVLDDHVSVLNLYNWCGELDPLNKMKPHVLARALYIGYEVVPKFKARDWVYRMSDKKIYVVDFVTEEGLILDDENLWMFNEQGNDFKKHTQIESVRHATPEEIAEEKERRWWAKHGREPWELRTDDVLTRNDDGFPWFVDGKRDTLPGYYLNGESFNLQDIIDRYRVMVFAENRLDVKDDE